MDIKNKFVSRAKVPEQKGYNFTPGCSGFVRVATTASWGGESRLGFVANSGSRSEGSIVEKICVGYKDELFVDILYGVVYAELLVDLNDNENHNFQQFKIILALCLFIKGACIMTIPVA